MIKMLHKTKPKGRGNLSIRFYKNQVNMQKTLKSKLKRRKALQKEAEEARNECLIKIIES